MKDLITKFSFEEILLYAVVLFLAIKEVMTAIDYFKKKWKDKCQEEIEKKEDKEDVIEKLNNSIQSLLDFKNNFDIYQKDMKTKLNSYEERLDMLVESDRDAIKEDIVKQYHYFVDRQGYIDDFSLDSLERRYKHYSDEGGNSYIEGLMIKIRQLPNKKM